MNKKWLFLILPILFLNFSIGLCKMETVYNHSAPIKIPRPKYQPTPYQSFDSIGGYQDRQIQDNTFKVIFIGNVYTLSETVENYALYRSSEITLQHEYNYFIVLESKNNFGDPMPTLPTSSYSPPQQSRQPQQFNVTTVDSQTGRISNSSGTITRNTTSAEGMAKFNQGVQDLSKAIAYRKALSNRKKVIVLTIQCFKGQKPDGDSRAFDAEQFIKYWDSDKEVDK